MKDLESMSDQELREFADKAERDNCQAASVQQNSEWHEACFAALFLACSEMNRRRLKPITHGGNSARH